MTTGCRPIVTLLDAFLDGELAPDRMLEVEEHLEQCSLCLERVRLMESFRASTQRAVRSDAVPTDALYRRVATALAAEKQREAEARASRVGRRARPTMTPWPPLAAAAALALGVSTWFGAERPRDTDARQASVDQASPQPLSAASSIQQLLDKLVDYHTSPPTPQITEPSLVDRLEPEVGVPVRLPSLKEYGASWEGGSVIPVQDQRAAFFRYRLSNHPVTIYVYNATQVPLRAALEPRVVHNRPIHVGAHRGYSIAALEQHGVGYAVATDLNDAESAELVASIH